MDEQKIRQIEAKIKEDVKNLNDLSKLKACLKNSSTGVKHAAIQSLRRIFLFLADKNRLKAPRSTDDKKEQDALEKFRIWLWEHYSSFLNFLYTQLSDKDDNTQVLALRSLMEFVCLEGKLNGNKHEFGHETFKSCLEGLVLNPKASQQLISVFEGEFMSFSDVQFHTLHNIHTMISEKRKAQDDASVCADFVKRVTNFLNKATLPRKDTELTFLVAPILENTQVVDTDTESEDSEAEEEQSKKRKAPKEKSPVKKRQRKSGVNWPKKHRKAFSQCWVDVLKLPLTRVTHRSILSSLPEKVLPHLSQPLLLADFLTDSYNVGGATSLLALNGLFILMQEHNFDYPEFYTKLYRLISDRTLIEDRNRSKFFTLVDLFLSSSHLPAYLVAAFVKRFARLSLYADPGALMFLIPFIYNQLLRHKECMQLIHRTGTKSVAEKAADRRETLACTDDVEKAAREALKPRKGAEDGGPDPFDNNIETNPEDSNALDSSLWELATLKTHYYKPVVALVKNMTDTNRTKPFDLSEYNGENYRTLFDQQFNISSAKCAISDEPSEMTKLFQNPQDKSDDIFSRIFAFPL